jgi:hypothetical protein
VGVHTFQAKPSVGHNHHIVCSRASLAASAEVNVTRVPHMISGLAAHGFRNVKKYVIELVTFNKGGRDRTRHRLLSSQAIGSLDTNSTACGGDGGTQLAVGYTESPPLK